MSPFHVLLWQWLLQVITRPLLNTIATLNIHWFFLCCGAIINIPSSQNLVREFAQLYVIYFSIHSDLGSDSKSRSKPANLFAFDAPSFHPIYASTFLQNFFQYIVIEGRTFDSAIEQLLNTTGLSHHSGIMRFWTCESQVKECLLKWAHSRTRPWGQQVPYQCPTCKCIQSWDQKGQGASSELGRDVTMQCSYKDEQGRCSQCLTFSRPASLPFKPIKLTEGVWMAIGLQKSESL
jgi:hypothetical protein